MATAHSAWDHPDPRGLPAVQGLLRVVVAVQCWGAAADRLQGRTPSDLARILFEGMNAAGPEAVQLDRFVAVALLLIGLISLVRPVWIALFAASGWFGAQAVAAAMSADGHWNLFLPAEQVIRAASPLALAFIDWWPPKLKFTLGRFLMSLSLLKWSAVISLAGQGLRTLLSMPDRPRLLELVERAAAAFKFGPWSLEQCGMAVGAMGGIDLGVALAFAMTRSRGVALIAGAWCVCRVGLWTFAFGPDGYAETLLRSGLVGAPLTIAAFSFLAVRERPPEILTAGEIRKAA